MSNATYATLQRAGDLGAERLSELLEDDEAWRSFKGSERANLVRLALEYAFGKPDAPIKREVSVQLTADSNDAVAKALRDMAVRSNLPEYAATGAVRPAQRAKPTDPNTE